MSNWKNTNIPQAKKNTRIAIVAAKFNEEYVNILLENTKKGLLECEIEEKNINIVRVPGAFEVPFACKKLMNEKKYDAIIALGIIIRGETIHFELVANETARGIMKLNTKEKIPVLFGVLACENKKQVEARLELGHDFAVSTVEMIHI